MSERWLPVPAAHAEVSDHGRVRCRCCQTLYSPQVSDGGYHRVRLRRLLGGKRWFKVHLLVLETFAGPRPSARHHGAHAPSNDKRDNRLQNLRWATPEENELDKRAVGTAGRGGKRKLLPLEVAAIVTSRHSVSRTARLHGVHRATVARLRARHQGLLA
jgi:hypothetical protein